MRYQITVAPAAAKQLAERLPEAVAAACVEFIYGALASQPHRVGAEMREPFKGQRRARRGEYRVRYTIDEDAGLVRVVDIDHRRDAYHS